MKDDNSERRYSRQLVGKTIVSKAGQKFGMVGDLIFETRTGELLYLVMKQATPHASSMDLEKTKDGAHMVPFSSVIATGDFVVVAEEDIV
jgi:sporulation protein YlmC with PRC-barrel domain